MVLSRPCGIERKSAGDTDSQILDTMEPHNDVNSLHGLLTEPLPLPESVPPQATRRDHRHDVGPLLAKGIATPWKLSLVLENKGNVARDHLASERTYLAYVRTSLACASAGVALVQLFMISGPTIHGIDLARFAKPLGVTAILLGLILLVLGVVRYFSTQSALIRGQFPVARHSVTMIAFTLGSLVAVVFGITIAGTKR